MGSLSDYAELELLDHVFNAAYTSVATVYLALCTGDPTDAGTGASMSECANANAYARTAISFSAAASRAVVQSGAVTFPQASGGGWGTVSHWAIVDGNTHGAGNMLAHGAFNESKAVADGNTPSVADTALNVTISAGEMSTYLANKLLDLMFRNTAYSAPATYIALADTTIADSDAGVDLTEPSGGAYARVQVNVNGGSSPTWDVAAAGALDNTHDISFTTATASWSTIVSMAVCDGGTTGAGEVLFYDNDMADQAVGNGDTVKFLAGALDVSLS